jgi:hypothetical protein
VSEYWFARRFPVGHPRNAMAPVTREGRMAFVWFVGIMVAGAVAWGLLAISADTTGAIIGGVLFIAACGYGMFRLLSAVVRHGDQNHTVDDYKSGRVGGRT